MMKWIMTCRGLGASAQTQIGEKKQVLDINVDEWESIRDAIDKMIPPKQEIVSVGVRI